MPFAGLFPLNEIQFPVRANQFPLRVNQFLLRVNQFLLDTNKFPLKLKVNPPHANFSYICHATINSEKSTIHYKSLKLKIELIKYYIRISFYKILSCVIICINSKKKYEYNYIPYDVRLLIVHIYIIIPMILFKHNRIILLINDNIKFKF